jgi:hypothetical protein
MTVEEMVPALAAIGIMEARGMACRRLREIVAADALGCERHRREYAALMIRMAGLPWPPGRVELTGADFARTRAHEFDCTCHLGGTCRPRGAAAN